MVLLGWRRWEFHLEPPELADSFAGHGGMLGRRKTSCPLDRCESYTGGSQPSFFPLSFCSSRSTRKNIVSCAVPLTEHTTCNESVSCEQRDGQTVENELIFFVEGGTGRLHGGASQVVHDARRRIRSTERVAAPTYASIGSMEQADNHRKSDDKVRHNLQK